MQSSRLASCGLGALQYPTRFLCVWTRTVSFRATRSNAEPVNYPEADGSGPNTEPRLTTSRRTLFDDASLPVAADGTAVSKRKLLDIHRQSLKDAGVKMDPTDLERNRLASLNKSVRGEVRGPAQTAVVREFKDPERRLYTTQRSMRPVEEERKDWSGGESRRWDGGQVAQAQDPNREQRGRQRRGDSGPEQRGREQRGPEQEGRELRGRERGQVRRGPRQLHRQDDGDSDPKSVAAPKERKVRTPRTEQSDLQDLMRADRVARMFAAAHVERKGGRKDVNAAQRGGKDSEDDDDDDEGEEEEGERGEEFSVEHELEALRSAEEGRGKDKRTFKGPALTHNLPYELNVELLKQVLAGEKVSPLPEVMLGHSGITPGIRAAIQTFWRTNDLVKLRIRRRRKTARRYIPYMKEVCAFLESVTGGVVVWRSGRSLWMYRGQHYTPIPLGKIRSDILKKREMPVVPPLLSSTALLAGREVKLPKGHLGYLTMGAPGPEDLANGSPLPPHVAVLFLHDAFGIGAPNTQQHCKQAADRLASMLGPGVPILMPDLLNGGKEVWQGSEWPPGKPQWERQQGWMARQGRGNPWSVVGILNSAVSYLRGPEVSASKVVLMGTGWGGWLVAQALAADGRAAAALLHKEGARNPTPGPKIKRPSPKAQDPAQHLQDAVLISAAHSEGHLELGLTLSKVQGAALVTATGGAAAHGGKHLMFSAGVVASANSFFGDEEALSTGISVPLMITCSKWDPMERFQLFMQPPLVDRCAFKRFGDLYPGFLGKQAKWGDEKQAQGANQALNLITHFIRWHTSADGEAEAFVRHYCMMGKAGVGEKQVTNMYLPWMPQVTLYRGHERDAARARQAALQELKQLAKSPEKKDM